MSNENKKEEGVDVQTLQYYFDAIEKDRFDRGVVGRRTGKVLALRDKLLSLSDLDFEVAMRSIDKLVADAPQQSPTLERTRRLEAQQSALELYEKVDANHTQTKSVKADKIQKV